MDTKIKLLSRIWKKKKNSIKEKNVNFSKLYVGLYIKRRFKKAANYRYSFVNGEIKGQVQLKI